MNKSKQGNLEKRVGHVVRYKSISRLVIDYTRLTEIRIDKKMKERPRK